MKLLLDENVSDRIVERIADLFPGSAHIKSLGLKEADDRIVWDWAKQHGFAIASKDTDFYQRAIVFGHAVNPAIALRFQMGCAHGTASAH